MKFQNSVYLHMALFLMLLISIKFTNSQEIEELIEPKCDDKTIKYSIFANLSEYLENENNIDNREIFKNLDDLKTKRVGTLSDLYFDTSKYDNITKYDSYDEMVEDLRHYKLDAIIVDDGIGNKTQMFTNDISKLPDLVELVLIGFGLQKDNKELTEQLNNFLGRKELGDRRESEKTKWLGINYLVKTLDRNLTGENGTLNVIVRLKNEPYSYKGENGEILGSEISFLYGFAKQNGYNLNFIETDTYDDQIKCLKNKSADIAAGFFQIRGDKRDEINFSDKMHPSILNAFVRYENLNDSIEWDFYESPEELNRENIGVFKDSSFVDLTSNNFKDSEIKEYEGTFELYQALLLEEIEGFLIDEPSAEYFELLYPDRLTYFRKNYEENEYAFGVQGNDLLNEFNEFLSNVNKKEIYDKWNVADTSKLTIDKNLNKSAPLLNAGFLMNLKPLCYKDGDEILGYEIELLYKFAKEKGYNINLMEINTPERISHIQDKKANITGGWFTASDERKKLINFTSPIHNAGTVLAVRTDIKKDTVKIQVVDELNNKKSGNSADIPVFFPKKNITTTSNCVFPEKYDDSILINCTISNLDDIDPYTEGFEYLNTSDKMFIAFANLELNNFFKANSIIPEHKDIIIESNKTNIVCTSPLNTIIITNNTNNITIDLNTTNNTYRENNNTNSSSTSNNTNTTDSDKDIEPILKKSSSSGGLSGGAIAGIVVASVVAFLAIVGTTLCCLKKKSDKIPFEENRANASAQDMKIPDV